jgi:hypothetical protein
LRAGGLEIEHLARMLGRARIVLQAARFYFM